MQMPATLEGILQAALAGQAPTRQDCVWLLGLRKDAP